MKTLWLVTILYIVNCQADVGFWWLTDAETTTDTVYETTTPSSPTQEDTTPKDLTPTPSSPTQEDTTPKDLIPKLGEIRKNNQDINIDDRVCCECLPFYLCLNGTIITDGIGVIDVRIKPSNIPPPVINVQTCPNFDIDICCAPPDVDPSCYGDTTPIKTDPPPLAPDTNCECIVHNQCDPGLVVSDGLGITSTVLSNGREVSHSKCEHSLDVCCYVPVTVVEDLYNQCECVDFFLCDSDGYIVTDGGGLLDVRIKPADTPALPPREPTTCAYDDSLLCCYNKPPDGYTFPSTPSPPLTSYSPSTENPALTSYSPSTEYPGSSSYPPDSSHCDICIQDYLCDNEGYIVTDGGGVLNVRIKPVNVYVPQQCPHDSSLVCCRDRVTDIHVESTSSYTPTDPPRSAPKQVCGVRNSLGIGTRIIGFRGGQTQFGEFPWVVTLLREEVINGEAYPLFLGGASLIHQRVVLTAAHKLGDYGLKDFIVRMGEWDASSTKETLPHQDLKVEKIIIHPGFNAATLANDVALLLINGEAKLDFHINPICPAKDLSLVDWSDCVTNGWGVDNFSEGQYQVLMKSVTLPLVDKRTCQNLLRKTRLSRHFRLHPSFICAGGEEGIDSCKGDGGGPLACRRKDDPSRYLQVGMTAWGIGCGLKDVPGVYVDIPYHYDWIVNTLRAYIPDYGFSPADNVNHHDLPHADPTEQPLTPKEKRKKDRQDERRREREEAQKAKQEERKRKQEERRRKQEERRANRQNRRNQNKPTTNN